MLVKTQSRFGISGDPLPAIEDSARDLTLGWIWLGVYSLLAAGVLALLLALSRTPTLQEMMPGSNFFRIALVVHVDLSVLIWSLACAGILWSLFACRAATRLSFAAFYLALGGTVLISISPFVGADTPLMSDYVPVLAHPWFFTALLIVTAGLVLQALNYLVQTLPALTLGEPRGVLRWGLALAALAALLAVVCMAASYGAIPVSAEGRYIYDLLFWGGGHVLQFVHTLLMLIAWLLLALNCGHRLPLSPGLLAILLATVVAPLLCVPALYRYDIESAEHLVGFTQLMRWGGLLSLPLGLVIAAVALRPTPCEPQIRPLRSALLSSMTLFAAGGLVGFLIRGSNTVIPAHYHGSTVGVTLAFMGLIYLLLPRLGRPLQHWRLAYWQPFIYGGGQLVHITALAWSGSQGVKRKTAGAAQGLDSGAEVIGMAVAGFGSLLAIIGGVIFLWVAVVALTNKSPDLRRTSSSLPD